MRANGDQRRWSLRDLEWAPWRTERTMCRDELSDELSEHLARLVPASEADRDPATRGPIGEG